MFNLFKGLPLILRYNFSKRKLYTWGENTQSLGHSSKILKPTHLKLPFHQFDKIELGVNHSAIISDGKLYTFGNGSNGKLGHKDEKNYLQPKEIQFFSKNKLKVIDVICGECHTICLTENGDVWSWGYGGRKINFVIRLIFAHRGCLGHGNNKNVYAPKPIQFFRNNKIKIQKISGGNYFVNAKNQLGQVYNWGLGDYAVFGDGMNKSYSTPALNKHFQFQRLQANNKIITIKSASTYSIGLFEDGRLYSWGSNQSGQLGIRSQIGVEMYETINYVTKIESELLNGQKIKNFEVGEDAIVILLQSNKVLWCGMKLQYNLELFALPQNVDIKTVGICKSAIGVVDKQNKVQQNNKIYMKNKFIQSKLQDLTTGILTYQNQKQFQNQNIIQIGGKYRNRYMITQCVQN